ncbi:siderophore-interacting protein [Mesorhizobium sp. SB112]|uniref:siderophore-interacting protein n=1 Tax=Mesorhizobium sp. SB112 TaxID=3151853 RepID=UPI00326490F2
MQTEHSRPTPSFQAEAEVAIADPERIIERVFDHFADHDAEITSIERGFSAAFFFGQISMQARPNGVAMSVTADDEATLARTKTVAASHLIEFVEGARPRFAWTGDGAGITKFPNLHEMTVEGAVDVTPHMRRITLSGPGLDRYVSGGQHFKLFVPPEGIAIPEWPVPGEDGLPVWPADDRRPKVRTYTVRSVDLAAGTIEADFVLHGDHSVGSRWALNAQSGDIVGVRGPVGRAVPEADWYLLVGDETALPVIARTLESLPASAKGIALVEVADESEQQSIDFDADIELRWLHRNGAEAGTTSLLVDAVLAVEMPPAGTRIHAMAGVEYTAFKAIRRHWRDKLKLDKKDVLPVAYWRRGRAEGEAVPEDKDD